MHLQCWQRNSALCHPYTGSGRKSFSWKSILRAFCMESVWSAIFPSSLSVSIKIAGLMTLLSSNAVWPCSCLCPQCLEVSPDNQTLANRSFCFDLQKVWGRTDLEISKQRLLGEGECLVSERVPSANCAPKNWLSTASAYCLMRSVVANLSSLVHHMILIHPFCHLDKICTQ